jgi:NADP-dependent 3-hydroxy acid dehydrogenase YdfG
MASLRLNVGGAAAAVESVLPGMLTAGRGSLLFTTGSAALTPDPARAASAVTTTAATTYIALLRQALDGSGVRVGHTVIVGPIDRDRDDAHHPDDVAADLWAHHEGRAAEFPSVLRRPSAS